jgi:hypothetical protein
VAGSDPPDDTGTEARMTQLLDAFPRRPFTLKPGRGADGGWLLALGGVLLFGAFIAMLAI